MEAEERIEIDLDEWRKMDWYKNWMEFWARTPDTEAGDSENLEASVE